MKLKRIKYITRLSIPKKGPRSIQVVKTCIALAEQNIDVFLYVKRNEFLNMESLSQYYGFQIPQGLHIKTLPSLLRFSSALIALFVCVKTIFDKNGTSLYVRDYTLAKYVIWLKWLHRLPVFFEVHGTPRISKGKMIIVNKEFNKQSRKKTMDFVHEKSDGLVCTYRGAEEFLVSQSVKTPHIYAWHGTEPDPNFNYSLSGREGIYYIGSFSKAYNDTIKTLLEAMKYVEKDEHLILIGGYKEEDITEIKSLAKNYGVLERVEFKGYVPYGETKNYLKSAKVVISLLWGSKLSHYLSCSVPLVVPDIPIVREVLHDGRDCVMFQHGNSVSIASAINKVLENPSLAETLARNAYETAQEYSWHNRANKILNFIESNIN